MKIGFIGLGTMGRHMAANLQKAGHELVVHDVRREAAESHMKAGARWADSPRAVAEGSDVVFASLPEPKDVEAVALDEKTGLLSGLTAGKAFFDLSTNSPTVVRKLHAVDVLECLLRRDLDCQHVRLAGPDPVGHVELMGVVHAHDLCVSCDLVAVQPDLGTVIDTRQLEQVGGMARGRLERRAVPPVLHVQILRYLVPQVLAEIEIGVGAVVLQHLEDGRGHTADGVPALARVVRTGDV